MTATLTELARGGQVADAADRRRIRDDLDATLFVEAGAGSGKTRALVDRVVALVASGVPMRAIVAITFTEKAAAELRDRIRRALERAASTDDDGRFRAALEQVDAAAISTLHAFAQRILTEHPIDVGLPPDVDVLDEVASEIAFGDRWRRFRDRLLEDPALEPWMLLGLAAGIRLDDVRQLALAFGDNWDLVADPDRVPWREEPLPLLQTDELVSRLDALLDRVGDCTDDTDMLCRHLTDEVAPYRERLRAAADAADALRLLRSDKPKLNYKVKGKKGNWVDKERVLAEMRAIHDLRVGLAERVTHAVVRRIAAEVAVFTLASANERRAQGRLEFHDLLVLARELLRGDHGADVRARLHRRYQRLLLDEFQDTDPIQIELAVLVASSAADARAQPWPQVPVEPGRLFFVGDPKQSIYRFRRADIGLFLQARDVFAQPALALTTNFRTTPPVIAWLNQVFATLITPEAGSQPAYQPLAPAPGRAVPSHGSPVVLLGGEHDDRPNAEALRAREAADVADAVGAALGWSVVDTDSRPESNADRFLDGASGDRVGPDSGAHVRGAERWRTARPGDITILLPARTSLPALERALDAAGVAYRAETSSLVYTTRAVRDLLMTVRALADPTDQLALVAALRSSVFACGDDDLVTWKLGHGGGWHLHAREPEGVAPGHPVGAALRYLRALHRDLPWMAPSEVLDRIARDRRLFEQGYAGHRPRDLWRRLRFVIDQARAWSAAQGGTLRQYVEWARMQASESTRVAETILPETDDDSVRIMTIHGSKGLEFPITILSGMTTAVRRTRARVEVAFPPGQPVGLRFGPSVMTPEFADFQPIDEQMDHHERLRLLYVACTRARDHLVVSVHRKPPGSRDSDQTRTNAELIWGAASQAPDLWSAPLPASPVPRADRSAALAAPAPLPSAPDRPAPLLSAQEWEAQRTAALLTSTRPRTVGATDVADAVTAGPDRDAFATDADQVDGADSDARPIGVSAAPVTAHHVRDETEAGLAKQPRDLDLAPWQKGRYGTAIGRAVHAVLQTVDLATGDGLDDAAAAQAAAEGVIGREDTIAALARAALAAPTVRAASTRPRWRETYVATTVGDRLLEGYVDLLYRTDDGLVVVDYKTASTTTDLDRRVDRYRTQGGAYALAVAAATGEPVIRVVFVFLTPTGPVERDLDDLDAAIAAVRAAVAA